jgi:hypothetical protein
MSHGYGTSAAKLDGREVTEDDIYADAYRIIDPGAVNAGAVAATLGRGYAFMSHQIGSQEARRHPALRAMAGQLAMLFKVDRWGGDIEDINAVMDKAKELGIQYPTG